MDIIIPMKNRINNQFKQLHLFSLMVAIMILCITFSNSFAERNKYIDDMEELVSTLESQHPGFIKSNWSDSKRERYQQKTDSLYLKISNIQSAKEFYFYVSEFLSDLNDGHTRLTWKELQKSPQLPFDVAWINDSIFIVSIANDSLENLLYCPIITIAEKSYEEIETEANKYISTDEGNRYLKRAYGYGSSTLIINGLFLDFIGLWDGKEPLEIELLRDGKVVKKKIQLSIPSGRINHFKTARNSITKQRTIKNCFHIDTASSVLYIQLNTLPFLGKNSFFRKAFRKGNKYKVNNLIVDIRNCEGGLSLWSDELFKYLIKHDKTIKRCKGWCRKEQELVSCSSGETIIHPYDYKRCFKGDVFIFMSELTTSSGTSIVVGVQDNNLGVVLGVPSGNNNCYFGDFRKIRLHNTGISFRYSTKKWVRVSSVAESKEDMLIHPDYIIKEDIADYKNNIDPLWNYVISNYIEQ